MRFTAFNIHNKIGNEVGHLSYPCLRVHRNKILSKIFQLLLSEKLLAQDSQTLTLERSDYVIMK